MGQQLHVAKVGDGYIASNQVPVLGTGTWGWWGPSPTGPFSPIGQLWDANAAPYGPLHSNWFTYGGRVINTSAGAIGVFSVNTWDDEGATVAGVYGPRFVTVGDHLIDRDPFGGARVDDGPARRHPAGGLGHRPRHHRRGDGPGERGRPARPDRHRRRRPPRRRAALPRLGWLPRHRRPDPPDGRRPPAVRHRRQRAAGPDRPLAGLHPRQWFRTGVGLRGRESRPGARLP